MLPFEKPFDNPSDDPGLYRANTKKVVHNKTEEERRLDPYLSQRAIFTFMVMLPAIAVFLTVPQLYNQFPALSREFVFYRNPLTLEDIARHCCNPNSDAVATTVNYDGSRFHLVRHVGGGCTVSYYDPHGRLAEICTYDQHLRLHAEQISFDTAGDVIATLGYWHGTRHGQWNVRGQPIVQYSYGDEVQSFARSIERSRGLIHDSHSPSSDADDERSDSEQTNHKRKRFDDDSTDRAGKKPKI